MTDQYVKRGPEDRPFDSAMCKAEVWVSIRRSWMQCSRKAVKNGWCKQHHPDAEAERKEKSNSTWEARMRSEAMGHYGECFMAALIKIRDGDADPCSAAAAALRGCKYAYEDRT